MNELNKICGKCGAPIRDHMIGGPAPYHPRPVRPQPETEQGVRAALLEICRIWETNDIPDRNGKKISSSDTQCLERCAEIARRTLVALSTPLPSEGAVAWPSVELMRVAIADGFNNGNQEYEDCDAMARMRFDAAARAVHALYASPSPASGPSDSVRHFAEVLRKWWSFDDNQQHTHSWHSREDFIGRELPKLLAASPASAEVRSATIEEGSTVAYPRGAEFQVARRVVADNGSAMLYLKGHEAAFWVGDDEVRALASGEKPEK